jgi:hypothetical protein
MLYLRSELRSQINLQGTPGALDEKGFKTAM